MTKSLYDPLVERKGKEDLIIKYLTSKLNAPAKFIEEFRNTITVNTDLDDIFDKAINSDNINEFIKKINND